jgi:oxygen-independent coproporphyrinogen-3 oxidase
MNEAILKQVSNELDRYKVQNQNIETLFIGGGTPSCIKASDYLPFFNKIKPFMKKDTEITIEANPNSASLKWLKEIKDLGVNRVSFGVQSFDDKKLKLLGRNHTPIMAIEAVKNAQKVGFQNISLDLIYGTHIDNKELLTKDLDTAFSLPINHISTYSLTIEENTPFQKTPQVSKDDENIAQWIINQIQKRGLNQYEISNFGSYQSKHNQGYWQHKDYIGIGSGAVGFLKDRRFYTQNDVNKYIKNPLKIEEELLSKDNIKSEKILLGLRSNIGFESSLLTKQEIQKAKILIDEDKIYHKNSKFFNNNFLLSDEIALFLLT